jgi:hypothetical protein
MPFVFDPVVALPHVEGETYAKLTLTRITIPNSETGTINPMFKGFWPLEGILDRARLKAIQ